MTFNLEGAADSIGEPGKPTGPHQERNPQDLDGDLRAVFSWPRPVSPGGRGGGNRTPDLRFWKPALYQLSYTPEEIVAMTSASITR